MAALEREQLLQKADALAGQRQIRSGARCYPEFLLNVTWRAPAKPSRALGGAGMALLCTGTCLPPWQMRAAISGWGFGSTGSISRLLFLSKYLCQPHSMDPALTEKLQLQAALGLAHWNIGRRMRGGGFTTGGPRSGRRQLLRKAEQ